MRSKGVPAGVAATYSESQDHLSSRSTLPPHTHTHTHTHISPRSMQIKNKNLPKCNTIQSSGSAKKIHIPEQK